MFFCVKLNHIMFSQTKDQNQVLIKIVKLWYFSVEYPCERSEVTSPRDMENLKQIILLLALPLFIILYEDKDMY